ncbi:hypothetical protein J5N97_012077 [Dioscorea zingiberensis]|uniref:Uncharacterized protein n=1 Tax=Dioscorea zingiberensis TaxID=325984 RepID=A0A9D5CN48_9LILI|nr:hypothetical protein J5N97_012077 [Dioscorea zingiberensis]
MALDDLCGLTGENVDRLPDYLEDAMKAAYKRYMAYLDAFGPDEDDELGIPLLGAAEHDESPHVIVHVDPKTPPEANDSDHSEIPLAASWWRSRFHASMTTFYLIWIGAVGRVFRSDEAPHDNDNDNDHDRRQQKDLPSH